MDTTFAESCIYVYPYVILKCAKVQKKTTRKCFFAKKKSIHCNCCTWECCFCFLTGCLACFCSRDCGLFCPKNHHSMCHRRILRLCQSSRGPPSRPRLSLWSSMRGSRLFCGMFCVWLLLVKYGYNDCYDVFFAALSRIVNDKTGRTWKWHCQRLPTWPKCGCLLNGFRWWKE